MSPGFTLNYWHIQTISSPFEDACWALQAITLRLWRYAYGYHSKVVLQEVYWLFICLVRFINNELLHILIGQIQTALQDAVDKNVQMKVTESPLCELEAEVHAFSKLLNAMAVGISQKKKKRAGHTQRPLQGSGGKISALQCTHNGGEAQSWTWKAPYPL